MIRCQVSRCHCSQTVPTSAHRYTSWIASTCLTRLRRKQGFREHLLERPDGFGLANALKCLAASVQIRRLLIRRRAVPLSGCSNCYPTVSCTGDANQVVHLRPDRGDRHRAMAPTAGVLGWKNCSSQISEQYLLTKIRPGQQGHCRGSNWHRRSRHGARLLQSQELSFDELMQRDLDNSLVWAAT